MTDLQGIEAALPMLSASALLTQRSLASTGRRRANRFYPRRRGQAEGFFLAFRFACFAAFLHLVPPYFFVGHIHQLMHCLIEPFVFVLFGGVCLWFLHSFHPVWF